MPKINIREGLLKEPVKDKWLKVGTKRRAGLLVPLFSVYSKNSIGIGDFADLKLLIDWASLTGNSIIQLLPMNEVGALFCPYDSISSFALEPLYLSLQRLSTPKNKSIASKIEKLKGNFSGVKAHLDYRVKSQKLRLLREIYSLGGAEESSEFKKFKEENAYWLDDFALYRILREQHQEKAWYDWEDKFRERDRPALQSFQREHAEEINFQQWLQWQLFQQFKAVKNYAGEKNVLLKGDLPILVSRDSADVWVHRKFFKLDFAAGAPPDMYAALGQRWGMPTYNWESIAADNYKYLREKLKISEQFYDILRIDHVVGLFRIWSIPYLEPLENKGLNGLFDPADEKEWQAHGRKLLSVMLESTKLLLCAEDLGIIPKTCPQVLKELAIPGNDVQRWVKDYQTKHDFLEPKDYRLLSVAMLSTHDTTNWPAWWENEAGTVDEGLFMRRCSDHRKIGFDRVKDRLFDLSRSRHGRLRWRDSLDSVEELVAILGRKKEELADFIEIYENTYREKEKLWLHLKLKGPMRQECDAEIIRAVLGVSLNAQSIFSINTILDWLYLTDVFSDDPYQYRINTPGTISDKNWSLRIPISLEELLKHKVTKEIRKMIADSSRI